MVGYTTMYADQRFAVMTSKVKESIDSATCVFIKRSTCTVRRSIRTTFLADRTVVHVYDRLLASYCRLSVCLSVCDAVRCGAEGRRI